MKRTILSAILVCCAAFSFAQSTSHTSSTSTSVRVSDSDHTYTLRADFDTDAEERIRKLITERLGNPNQSSGTRTWKLEEVYLVTLKPRRVSLELDKEKASGSLTRSFVKLGKDIQQAISQAGQ